MGQDKALLRVPGTGQTLLAHIVARLVPLVTGVVVIVVAQAKSDSPDGKPTESVRVEIAERAGLDLDGDTAVQIVADRYPGAGALGGLATGLHAVGIRGGWCMCVACDMPFVSPVIMEHLIELTGNQAAGSVQGGHVVSAVLPRVEGRLQPFHGLYHPAILTDLERALDAGILRVGQALDQAGALVVDEPVLRALDPGLRAFVNVNTPAEWALVQSWLADEP